MGKLSSILDELGNSYIQSEMELDNENQKRNYNNGTKEDIYSKNNTTNAVARVIKVIAILNIFAGITLGLVNIEEFETYAVVLIIASIISSIFIYAIGEIIQLLEDIKNK